MTYVQQRDDVYTPLSWLKKKNKTKKKNNAHGVVGVPDVNKLNRQPIGQISPLAGLDLDAKVSCQKAFILLESPVTCSTTTDCSETHHGRISCLGLVHPVCLHYLWMDGKLADLSLFSSVGEQQTVLTSPDSNCWHGITLKKLKKKKANSTVMCSRG